MENCRLVLDSDGDLWLQYETEALAILLGPPRESLYDDVPAHLWPALARLIDQHGDEARFARAYRQEVKDTYDKGKL